MIVDAGHDATEALLSDIEKRVSATYAQAMTEASKKLEDYLQGFLKRDEAKRALLDAGKITQEEYTTWRRNQMLTGQRWLDLQNTLAEDLVNADKISMSIVNGYTPEAYAINMNYGTYQVESVGGVNTGFTLYDRSTVERLIKEQPDLLPAPKVDIPADLRWNKQHIANEITQGVLQGESVNKVAKRLKNVAEMDNKAAMRNARTAITGAQNAGRVASYKRAAGMGIKLKQEWLAVMDNRTRDEHRRLDGQQVAVGEKFHVDGYEIEYPGDPAAEGFLVYNCRCTLIPAIEGISSSSAHADSTYEGMSYEEWENGKK